MTMISVQQFCNHAVSTGTISDEDLLVLKREVLPEGLMTREEADLLIALERAVIGSDAFADFLVALVVDFAVWGTRPTGYIDRDVAAWLAASLSGRDGPSPVGARIAMEIVREAQGSAESLMAFALEANRRIRDAVQPARMSFALAA
ncbi:hypothetical protein SAMN05216360_106293 [Methylobacterium phyllostachyos]|uniref:Thymidine phosphorylase n=1 Tax=Methylobacterium phyllostachyos TaxID=582672 RepID=A0A1G9ZIX5_9HYPH|nr:hypothetical protein [Methylobacterium phyllostachyos]SDN21268.1 hypothetical protein SAMN05216360_106293 [Methylobacterium phyllostachyos]